MKPKTQPVVGSEQGGQDAQQPEKKGVSRKILWAWRRRTTPQNLSVESSGSSVDGEKDSPPTEKWSLGILNDLKTEEVPGMSMAIAREMVF